MTKRILTANGTFVNLPTLTDKLTKEVGVSDSAKEVGVSDPIKKVSKVKRKTRKKSVKDEDSL